MTPESVRILIIDDEPNIVSLLIKVLHDEGYGVLAASGGREGVAVADRELVHLALVDLTMPDLSGLEVLKALKERDPGMPVIIMTAYATAETAVEAMKQGALDYLIKPFSMDELKIQIRRALEELGTVRELSALRREIRRRGFDDAIIGESPRLREVLALTAKVADADTTVLVAGETGTGKELVARALHAGSRRREGPFLAVNCSAIPETLLERELFGHEKGAYTGADAARPGLLEASADGTLLLDEIGEMSAGLQAKLLRVLEGHAFMRVGGVRPITCHTRFVAATNKDLAREAAEGRFRQDLFYRLNVVTINLPPLRDRGADVQLLANYFLQVLTREHARPPLTLSPAARDALARYRWPGNIRELRNVIERAVMLSAGDTLAPADLVLETVAGGEALTLEAWLALPLGEAKDAFERFFLGRALRATGGNISQAADRIGLDRKHLQDKIRKYDLKAGS
jgi:DNA-binding NtrC family response regulator